MQPKLQPDTAPRFDPRSIDDAARRAHALRNQAIDDAARQLGRWLRRLFTNRSRTVAQEQPCHS